MNTQKANTIIAEFMGGKYIKTIDEVDFWRVPERVPNTHNASMGKFEYHSRWDWLMPVIEKIETIEWTKPESKSKQHYAVILFKNSCTIEREACSDTDFIQVRQEDKITAAWKACLEFVQWYDQHTAR